MNDTIIRIKDISKKYSLGERQSYYSFRDTISSIFKFPFRKNRLKKDEFWALKDVSLDIKEGEIVGIIGSNGAGKSTLLKILSRITPPTSGQIELEGRIASLLEVGTGFHPELTGKENIYLNGAVLGMKRKEINSKFDNIVKFAEIEKFLDTPVKHYSSGMYMRLAFSVAAHLESEILIVDEVLAVGDTEFQKKCLKKMNEISKNEGRTLLFVSHNLSAIKNLCSRAILLESGKIIDDGHPDEIISRYVEQSIKIVKNTKKFKKNSDVDIQFFNPRTTNQKGKEKNTFNCDEPVFINFSLSVNKKIKGLYGYLNINKDDGNVVLESDSFDLRDNRMENLIKGIHHFRIEVPKRSISPGKYYIYLNFTSIYGFKSKVDTPGIVSSFELSDNNSSRANGRKGYFSTLLDWKEIS